jgi:glycosyltransferase involved in cell wall biosynthesis
VTAKSFRLCQVHLERYAPSETFARATAERLPCHVSVVHGEPYRPLYLDDSPLQSRRPLAQFARLTRRAVARARGNDAKASELTSLYVKAFRRARCQAVYVEFGQFAVQVMDACRRLELPLIVHFHGIDAHSRSILDRYGGRYPRLFEQAVAIITNSRTMERALLELGARPEKTHYVPNGVDADRFRAGAPAEAPPTFLSVGRFAEKKGPQLTIAAFASVCHTHPEAQLRMIGDGRIRGVCQDLAQGLGVGEAVTFLGAQPHEVVAEEMRRARAFVQHSVVASDGNSETMPNAILEASASGLPVVATRHAGIPEVVVDGETGFLVEERDVEGMARQMARLVLEPGLAAELGRAGRKRMQESFSIESRIARLWEIIRAASGSAL